MTSGRTLVASATPRREFQRAFHRHDACVSNERMSAGRPNRDPEVCLVQGSYYAATGLWPIVSMKSFEAGDRSKARSLGLVNTVWLPLATARA